MYMNIHYLVFNQYYILVTVPLYAHTTASSFCHVAQEMCQCLVDWSLIDINLCCQWYLKKHCYSNHLCTYFIVHMHNNTRIAIL